MRQLYDLRTGERHGAAAALMGPVVAMLDEASVVAVAAYAASLPP